MPEIVEWPGNLQVTDRADPRLAPNTRSPGPALNGDEQIISSASRRWTWQIQVPIYRKDQIRALRVVLAELDGRYGYLRINMCDTARITRKDMGAIGYDAVPHSDGAYFSDGSGYAAANGSSHPVGNAAANATSLQIDISDPEISLSTGVLFSINGWLYLITGIDDPEDLDNPGTIRTIHFKPPLRYAVTTDDELMWKASVVWRLATDDEGEAFLRLGKFGVVTLNLVEPVSREEIDAS